MRATYFDGRTAHAHPVTLAIDDGNLLVSGEGISRQDPIGAVNVSDVLGSTRRVLQFVDGASCEVADNEAFATMLAGHGVAPSRVSGWERSWRPALAALVIVLVTGVLGYQYGLPMFAERAANALPESTLNTVSFEMQRVFDKTVFSPTKIPGERQVPLLSSFDDLVLPDHRRLTLEFRNAEGLGANAMALPSGAIYMTDQLVALTSDDRVLLAVIAHEAGHVKRRHGLRQIIQGATVAALITWYFGDFSALGAAAPASLLQAKYSRDLEREADAYAAQVLKMNNLPVSILADALELIQKSHGPEGKEDAGALGYLSTHPATSERLAWLRAQ
jgi:Zn-dependent protease with chaperone function